MTTPNNTPKTITIQLTKGYSTTIDAIDADILKYSWRLSTVVEHYTVYASTIFFRDGKRIIAQMHRMILERAIGRPLTKKELVDHIDGNGLNNCRSNLRIATSSQNMQNSKKSKANTSGFKGVSYHRRAQKWCAAISVNGKNKYLGLFESPEKAHEAYCEAAKKYFGEFAKLE